MHLSWSVWGFGQEALAESADRLVRHGLKFIELPGNRFGTDLGFDARETKAVLSDKGLAVSGLCGIYSPDCELSSNRPHVRQRAIDYIRRQVDLCRELGGAYLIVVPGAVGRTAPVDPYEFDRSVETLRMVAGHFLEAGVKAAVEPIRSAEVSLCNTLSRVLEYIEAVGHEGVGSVNLDLYHMWTEEAHTGEAILAAGDRLANLHLADSNRGALGDGQMDIDTALRALYLIGHNRPGRFCTAEPLGPGGDPYPAMYGRPDPAFLDSLVERTVRVFREREAAIKS
jgi:sugar phosphate isomerase/epimerase